jgi:Lysine-specific metallo-endopeptidase
VKEQFSFQTAPFNVGGEQQESEQHGRWFRQGDRIIVLLDSPPAWDEQEIAYGHEDATAAVRTTIQPGVHEENYLPVGGSESMVWEAPSSAPVFGFVFPPPAGCPALTEAEYHGILRQAVIEAVRLANNAASKLEAVSPETARLYRFFFCHDPSRPVPWADNEASGSIVARRFRAVARELGGGRRMIFRCDPHCPHAGTRGFSLAEPNVISLCPPFWNPPLQAGLAPEGFRAGVILHEMFHVLFTMRHIADDPNEKRTNNAHCLRSFALRAMGYGQDNLALGGCTGDPC